MSAKKKNDGDVQALYGDFTGLNNAEVSGSAVHVLFDIDDRHYFLLFCLLLLLWRCFSSHNELEITHRYIQEYVKNVTKNEKRSPKI